MSNVKFNHKKLFFSFCLFKQRKVDKQNKTKLLLKLLKPLVYLSGGETANHVNLMQPVLVSYSPCFLALQRVTLEECQNINFWKLV